MRRDRSLRNFREYLLRRKNLPASQRVLQKQLDAKNINKDRRKVPVPERHTIPVKPVNKIKSSAIGKLAFGGFIATENYVFKFPKPLKVCHVIDSLGVGGAQTMMFELVNGLRKYYSSCTENYVVILSNPPHPVNYDKKFLGSYGIEPIAKSLTEISKFCIENNIDVIIQHRTHSASCIRTYIPTHIKYILINHTVNNLQAINRFLHCDAYVSVCDYLEKATTWPSVIHDTRKFVILNGIETNNESAAELAGGFITGRCHRLIPSKFKMESLRWIDSVRGEMPDHIHYIMGTNKAASNYCSENSCCKYFGTITKRDKKMSIIKRFDAYFYDTYSHEGASVAILEALSSGVPVICKSYGGNIELVRNKVNGFVVEDLRHFIKPLKNLYSNREELLNMKKQVIEDFEKRLHVRHTACKYVQLMESLVTVIS